MENVIDTVISQYANSPTLLQLVESMDQYFDPTTNFEDFYEFLWNVDTAQGFGLDVWGKIVNVTRELTVPGEANFFGFSEETDASPFNQAPFYSGPPGTRTYVLGDDAYRVLILTKALYNISGSSAESINQLLRNLFPGRGRCYVRDLGAMQILFVFEFTLQPFELAILTQSGAVPRPAGVSSDILQIPVPTLFGFAEGSFQPFDNGVFYFP